MSHLYCDFSEDVAIPLGYAVNKHLEVTLSPVSTIPVRQVTLTFCLENKKQQCKITTYKSRTTHRMVVIPYLVQLSKVATILVLLKLVFLPFSVKRLNTYLQQKWYSYNKNY